MLRTLTVAAVSMVISTAALAQTKDKTYKDWTVYTTTLEGKRTCYMASFPKKKNGNYTRRDEPYFLVTRIDDDHYEVSTSSGYGYKKGSDVAVKIDGKSYNMFTKGELAWANDSAQDKDMIARMKAKSTMTVKGTSTKNTYSIDSYSLSGFTAGLKRVSELCR